MTKCTYFPPKLDEGFIRRGIQEQLSAVVG
jgi:hypothetical protein